MFVRKNTIYTSTHALKRLFIAFFVVGLAPFAASAVEESAYIYPLETWNTTWSHGEEIYDGVYHMGVDAGGELPAGAPVYAIADGVVKESQVRSQFGLVVLIEHDSTEHRKIVSLYGHLDPDDVVVEPGDTVTQGQRIGSLGTREENGGWPVHIHFGIHKTAYSSDWIYWGHVRDQNLTDSWYNPTLYISRRPAVDIWQPSFVTDLKQEDFYGDAINFTIRVGDRGSKVESVKYLFSTDRQNWSTLAETSRFLGERYVTLPISNYANGTYYLRIIVEDETGLTKRRTYTVHKDPRYSFGAGYAATTATKSNAHITLWSAGGTSKIDTLSPLRDTWRGNNDVAVYHVANDPVLQYVVGRGRNDADGRVLLYNNRGERLLSLIPFAEPSQVRLDTGNIVGNGDDEIIVASGPHQTTTLVAYTRTGQELWRVQPFGRNHTSGVDVAAANVLGDWRPEIIISSRKDGGNKVSILDQSGNTLSTFTALDNYPNSGLNVAVGDVHPHEGQEIIVSSENGVGNRFRIYSIDGEPLIGRIMPFSPEFTGSADVTTVRWSDTSPTDAIIVAVANNGQTRAKGYTWDGKVLYSKLLYDEEFVGGIRVNRED